MKEDDNAFFDMFSKNNPFLFPLFKDDEADSERMRGFTDLFDAAFSDDLQRVNALLDEGADINERNSHTAFREANGATALHGAVHAESLPMLSCLLGRGADPELGDAEGLTPLMRSAEAGSLTMVRLLLAQGAALGTHSQHGETVFHIAAARDMVEILRFLLSLPQAKTLFDQPNSYGFTPLMKATSHGALPSVKLLSQAGADIRTRCHRGDSLLHLAAASGHAPTLRWVLKQGFNADDTNNEGTTPLHLASQFWEKSEIISLLVKAGADVERRGNNGMTPLCIAVCKDRVETLRSLLKAGADVNAHGCSLGTALHIAATHGFAESTKLLLQFGGNPNIANRKGYTPLHMAALFYESSVLRQLLRAGADVNAIAATGLTPLAMSAINGEDGATRALLKAGADATICARGAVSPLEIADTFGHAKVARIFMREYTKCGFEPTFCGKSVKGLESFLKLQGILG